ARVGPLAGVNRLYFGRFEFKRQRAFLEKMAVAPPQFAGRLEALFTLPPADAIAELAALVTETQAIVERELPEVDVSLRRPPGAGVEAWGLKPAYPTWSEPGPDQVRTRSERGPDQV